MKQNSLKGETAPTDIVGPAVPTEVASSNRLHDLASKWEADARRLAQLGAHPQAELIRQYLREFHDAIDSEERTLLTLTVAAQMCGYSADHLGRLVRQGTVPNYGRKGSPKLRLGDLPKKARAVVAGNSSGYSPNADARSILSRGRRVA